MKPIVRSSGAHKQELDPADSLIAPSISRETAGIADVCTDDTVEDIEIGVDAAVGTIFFAATDLSVEGVSVQSETVSFSEDSSVGSDGILSVTARGASVQWTDAVETALDPAYTAASILGAVNQATTLSSALPAGSAYTNSSGSDFSEGELVAITGTTIALADATTNNALSFVAGALAADTPDTESGQVHKCGLVNILLGPAEGSPAAGDVVFLSTTAGLGTLSAPSAALTVIVELGVIVDPLAYSNSGGGLVSVLLNLQRRSVN